VAQVGRDRPYRHQKRRRSVVHFTQCWMGLMTDPAGVCARTGRFQPRQLLLSFKREGSSFASVWCGDCLPRWGDPGHPRLFRLQIRGSCRGEPPRRGLCVVLRARGLGSLPWFRTAHVSVADRLRHRLTYSELPGDGSERPANHTRHRCRCIGLLPPRMVHHGRKPTGLCIGPLGRHHE
jgi:hypothetical protein